MNTRPSPPSITWSLTAEQTYKGISAGYKEAQCVFRGLPSGCIYVRVRACTHNLIKWQCGDNSMRSVKRYVNAVNSLLFSKVGHK